MFEKTIEFLKTSGWEVKEIEGAPGRMVRCSVGEFSFNLGHKSPQPNVAEEELFVLLPHENDEIWALVQLVQDSKVEVLRCRQPINPDLLEK